MVNPKIPIYNAANAKIYAKYASEFDLLFAAFIGDVKEKSLSKTNITNLKQIAKAIPPLIRSTMCGSQWLLVK